ncbi:hypothetical protein [Bradyrhizobium sp. LHD-71]|uniref:hypothetical protein n=1 Tax=Bradyrhizobium sp. LHD-71 TaxID=3072141 RepID=UPI00280E02E0|nr:hypothetical protein [Bradyrhizobium sp. LHD-71]MDQ8726370.1 hypothetical protein [Bradyrhizobium sp. LHD-71]
MACGWQAVQARPWRSQVVDPQRSQEKALGLKQNVLENGVPGDTRGDAKDSTVRKKFYPFATEWRLKMEKGLRHPKARQKLKNIIDNHCKPLHDLWLDEIMPKHVEATLLAIWHLREMSRD